MARASIRRCCAAAVMAALVAGTAHGEERKAAAIEVVGTTLQVRLPDGTVKAGAELVGAVLNIATGSRALRVRIAGVEPDARDPRGEVLLYDFRVLARSGSEEPLCAPDPDGRRLALPLAGRSDAAGMLTGAANTFELACTAGAQAKCVRFGYGPWREAPDGRPMRDFFNA